MSAACQVLEEVWERPQWAFEVGQQDDVADAAAVVVVDDAVVVVAASELQMRKVADDEVVECLEPAKLELRARVLETELKSELEGAEEGSSVCGRHLDLEFGIPQARGHAFGLP